MKTLEELNAEYEELTTLCNAIRDKLNEAESKRLKVVREILEVQFKQAGEAYNETVS